MSNTATPTRAPAKRKRSPRAAARKPRPAPAPAPSKSHRTPHPAPTGGRTPNATSWRLTPHERVFDASPAGPNGEDRYNPAQFGIVANAIILLYEHEMAIPREYAGVLEFGGTYLRGDLGDTKRRIKERLTALGLIGRREEVFICIDIESTPEDWEQLKKSKPLAAASVLEDFDGAEISAAQEWRREVFRWHSAILHYVKRLVPGALVTFYNAPWMHRALEKPGHFQRYNELCDWFAPSLYRHDPEQGIKRVRHARQIAGEGDDRPVIPLIFPDDIDLAADYLANGADAVCIWSTFDPAYYAHHMSRPEAQRLTRWPTEELIPA